MSCTVHTLTETYAHNFYVLSREWGLPLSWQRHYGRLVGETRELPQASRNCRSDPKYIRRNEYGEGLLTDPGDVPRQSREGPLVTVADSCGRAPRCTPLGIFVLFLSLPAKTSTTTRWHILVPDYFSSHSRLVHLWNFHTMASNEKRHFHEPLRYSRVTFARDPRPSHAAILRIYHVLQRDWSLSPIPSCVSWCMIVPTKQEEAATLLNFEDGTKIHR